MARCGKCKWSKLVSYYGQDMVLCTAVDDLIEIEVAENNDLGCEFYVDYMDDDDRQEP